MRGSSRRLLRPGILIAIHILASLAYFIMAADMCATDGLLARRLGIPLSGITSWSFLLVPFAAILPFILPRKAPAWFRFALAYVLIFMSLYCPLILLGLGSDRIPLPEGTSSVGLGEKLTRELGFPVILMGDGDGNWVYFSRAHDRESVGETLKRIGEPMIRPMSVAK